MIQFQLNSSIGGGKRKLKGIPLLVWGKPERLDLSENGERRIQEWLSAAKSE